MVTVSKEKMAEALSVFSESYSSPVYVNVNVKGGFLGFGKNYFGYAAISNSGQIIMVDFSLKAEHARYHISPNTVKLEDTGTNLGFFMSTEYEFNGKKTPVKITIPKKITGYDIGDQTENAKAFISVLNK